MKKKILFLILALVAIGFVYKYSTQESEVEKLHKKHAEFLKSHKYNKTLSLSKKERKAQGLPPNAYFEQEYLNEINPNTGRTHPENYIQLQQELKEQRLSQRVPGDASNNTWTERGPNNIGGRTRMIMFDPNDATHKRVFAGGVSGGLWVNNDITDANSSWIRVGIDENLSVSCMTVDPNNSQIMYLGTGESYTGDSIGNGVWKSTDGGVTWVNVFSDNFNADISQRLFYINDIKAWNNPTTNLTEIFIGVGKGYYGDGDQWVSENKVGLYKSSDDGVSWSKITMNTTQGTSYEPNDIETGADNTIWIGTVSNSSGHGGGTVLKSIDGATFTVVHTIATPNTRRTQIAVSKQNAGTIYVLAQVRTFSGGQYVAPFLKMIKTTDGFSTTTNMNIPADADNGIPNNDFTRGQAWYDLLIEVDPVDDTKVYVGGIDLFRSTDSGSTWKQISKWSNNNNLGGLTIPLVHADQHSWAFHPTDADKAVIGNDGGIFYASSLLGAETMTNGIQTRNKDYNITQFYHGGIGQDANSELLLAGAQDNGTQFINGAAAGINGTAEVYGGDGAYSFIDKDGEYMIASYVYNVKRRINLPYDGTGVTISSDQTTGSFINPQALDDNLDIMYSNGSTRSNSYRISRFSGIKAAVTRTDLSNGMLNARPTTLKVSPFTTGVSKVYIGTANGRVLIINSANLVTAFWTNITGTLPAGNISSISFGANENEILVTYHNYGVKSIWFTEDGGTTWQDKEGDFPDIPVKAIMMNPLNNDQVIIGTQLGVWYSYNFKDANPTWQQAYNGMSNVKVTSFSLRTADNTVMASTYGRGMFTGQFTVATASVNDVIFHKKAFTIYPTVSNGEFTVFAKNTLGKSTIHIFDIRGKQVHTQNLNFKTQEKQKVSVRLNPGVYIVNLVDENNKKSSSKIIIK